MEKKSYLYYKYEELNANKCYLIYLNNKNLQIELKGLTKYKLNNKLYNLFLQNGFYKNLIKCSVVYLESNTLDIDKNLLLEQNILGIIYNNKFLTKFQFLNKQNMFNLLIFFYKKKLTILHKLLYLTKLKFLFILKARIA